MFNDDFDNPRPRHLIEDKRPLQITDLPTICDIQVRSFESFVNFKKVVDTKEKKILGKNKKKNKNQKADKKKVQKKVKGNEDIFEENKSSDGEEEDKLDANGNKPEKAAKPKKLPQQLRCYVKYNFKDSIIALCFGDDDWEWSKIVISMVHKPLTSGAEITIPDEKFQYIEEDFVYNFTSKLKFSQIYKVSIKNIDRCVLAQSFTIKIAYLFLEDKDMQHYATNYSFDIPYFQKSTKLTSKFLGHFHADDRIVKLYNTKFKKDETYSPSHVQLLEEIDNFWRSNLNKTVQNTARSTEMIKYALNIEDLAGQDELMAYSARNVQLEGTLDDYSFHYPHNKLPPNCEEMSLCLVPMHLYEPGQFNTEDESIYTQVEDIYNNYIYFKKKTRAGSEKHNPRLDIKYFIRFIPNRITYRACFHAFDTLRLRLLTNYFSHFEDLPLLTKQNRRPEVTRFVWCNQNIATNEEQKQAIKNIVNRSSFPFPYVCHGPPGTGKTSLIVETILQILQHQPNAKVLVTAQSNSACDEVGERLLKFISVNKVYRFYSPSLLNPSNGEKSKILSKISNLRNGRNEYPSLEEFSHFNVFIVTLMSCSRFVQFDGVELNHHFDYIFVDECAAASEPEALVPIVGLGTDIQCITTQFVFLGDHKQLGPVINSDMASRLGLGMSLMERVLSTRRYRMDPITKEYDSKYVTQLLDNFRSHPAILQFSNVMFYDSKLRAKLQEPERSLGTKWNYLSNNKFPILFHCNKTPSQIIKNGTSSFNDGEVNLVRFYVDILLKCRIGDVQISESDIGVVSPYKAQLDKLKKALNHAKKVEIGTAEYYQGREKRIIIISTVKSKDSIGFLKSEKRLNVCVTRAKTLLIVVGNADTLQRDSLWNSFMHFCRANDGVCGDPFDLKRLTEKEQKILDEINSVMASTTTRSRRQEVEIIDQEEALKAIQERLQKIEILTKKVY